MAPIRLENGESFEDLDEIRRELAPLHIELQHWPIEKTAKVAALLSAD